MKHEMNFLPVNPGKKKRKSETKKIGWLILSGLLFLVLAIYGVLFFLDWQCQNEIKRMDAIIDGKSDYQVIYTNLSHQKEVLEHRQLLLESVRTGKELPLQTMVEIQQRLPAGVRLSSYDFQDDHLIVSGETRKKEAILEYKEKLSDLDIFKEIMMVNTNKKEEPATDNKKAGNEEVWEFTFEIQVIEV